MASTSVKVENLGYKLVVMTEYILKPSSTFCVFPTTATILHFTTPPMRRILFTSQILGDFGSHVTSPNQGPFSLQGVRERTLGTRLDAKDQKTLPLAAGVHFSAKNTLAPIVFAPLIDLWSFWQLKSKRIHERKDVKFRPPKFSNGL